VEEEDTYEPSLSDDASDDDANNSHAGGGGAPASGTARSHGTAASLLDRGEAALSTMDRVKAIEGVMVYNHLRDKVKEFLKPYAESGQAVSADDIKAYFEKLRGDETAIKEASGKPLDSAGHGSGSRGGGGGGDADRGDAGGNRKEQSGY
jgi:E3 ubiquitin-protein ligase UBR7